MPAASTASIEKRLLHLLAEGDTRRFRDLLNANYRFPSRSQGPWLEVEGLADPNNRNRDSQEGKHLPELLGIAEYVLAVESGKTDTSNYRLVAATKILQNTAWHARCLDKVVLLAGRAMAFGDDCVKENAADAVKNAANHPGGHIDGCIAQALEFGNPPQATPRMRSAYVRALQDISGHSKYKLQTGDVRNFLGRMSRDSNSVVSGHARETYAAVFGEAFL